jgi:hypothetical protein
MSQSFSTSFHLKVRGHEGTADVETRQRRWLEGWKSLRNSCRGYGASGGGDTAEFRTNKNDFERRMAALLMALDSTQSSWSTTPQPTTYSEAITHLSQFAEYKKTSKRAWVKERQELAALYSNIQTKLRTYSLRSWEPREGLRLAVSLVCGEELMEGSGGPMVCFLGF